MIFVSVCVLINVVGISLHDRHVGSVLLRKEVKPPALPAVRIALASSTKELSLLEKLAKTRVHNGHSVALIEFGTSELASLV